MTAVRADDALKYAAAAASATAEWALDAIGGSLCDHGHEDEANAIADTVREVAELAAQYGDPMRYSDGRAVKTTRDIAPGLVTSHVWQPNPGDEKPQTWTGELLHDPGTPRRGSYTVTTDPLTQEIHVRVMEVVR